MKKISDKQIINFRKQYGKINTEAKMAAKADRCVLCNKQVTSFCNSHSIPQFCLKNIAVDGKVLQPTAAMGFNAKVIDIDAGMKSAGTFRRICRECDGKYFQDYESTEKLQSEPSDKLMAEIAVKDCLVIISKRELELKRVDITQRDYNMFVDPQKIKNVKALDLSEQYDDLNVHRNVIEGNFTDKSPKYRILFRKILPYRCPIAAQSSIVLTKNMNNYEVNDVYDFRENTRMQSMHLCVFPFESTTLVLLFYHRRDKNYRNLWHEFNSEPEDKVLRYINYLIFEFTENYFISPIKKDLIENENLNRLSREINGRQDFAILNKNNNFGTDYEPINMDEIPNFLSEDEAIIP